jgi:CheY-like chemotaxis protein
VTYTLLWVEDDPNDIVLGERLLVKAGFEEPMIVRDGEEAVAYLSGKGEYADRVRFPVPSLVLLDMKLPKLSGLEVVKWMRAQAGIRRIPVVILTSSAERHDIDRAYDWGVNAYLVKPVEMHVFLDVASSLHRFWRTFNANPEAAPPAG